MTNLLFQSGMKKIILLIITVTIFMGCSKNEDEEEIDCSLYDPIFPSLYVRIVDSTGENLIDNGTIDPNNISVEGDFPGAGFQFVPENELLNSDADLRELDNSLRLFNPNESTFQYTINLDDIDETIKINFTAELTRIPCDITFFKPIEGVYKNQALELREVRSLQFVGDLNVSFP